MATINQLSTAETLSPGDLVPVFSTNNGDARKASMSTIQAFVQDGFVPDGGLMAISGYYNMRKIPVSPVVIPIGTSYANFPNYDTTTIILPPGRNSIAPMVVVGEFVMQRDCAAVLFWAGMTAAWPANRELTLAVLIGSDLNPYETITKFISLGRGAGYISPFIGGPVINNNNPGGTIKAGEKVRLVAKMDVADNLTLARLTFKVQTLDGI